MNWENEVRLIVGGELRRREVTYKILARKLNAMGVEATEASIANKMSRGTFSFLFFLQSMRALGIDTITLNLSANK